MNKLISYILIGSTIVTVITIIVASVVLLHKRRRNSYQDPHLFI